jgi:REP element-mobilizing transposase RayT
MARLARLHVPGGLYHVILRGRKGRELFPAPRDRRLFVSLLSELPARFDFQILAYVLLADRVQLAVLAGKKPLSAPLQALVFRYAKALNDKEGREGPIFYDRFKAILVDPAAYLPTLVRYLHLLPVRVHLSFRAESYPWSSARAYDDVAETPWLARHHLLDSFGEGTDACRAFTRYTRRGADAPRDPDLEAGLEGGNRSGAGARLIFGSEEFAVAQMARAEEDRASRRRTRADAPAFEDILALVCRDQGLRPEALSEPSRNRRASYARALVACLADDLGSATLAETARQFRRDLSGISRARAKIARDAESDPALAQKLNDLRARLAPQEGGQPPPG